RDKYQETLKLYWVERDLLAEIEDETEERFQDRRSGNGKDLEPPRPMTGRSNALMGDDGVIYESDDDEPRGRTPNHDDSDTSSPDGKPKPKPSGTMVRETALEAVESVTDVLDQVLKIRSKLENQIGKLEVLKDAESQKNLMLA
ncbi:Cdk3, partial [Symbiodinium microadriaticum]